MQQCKVIMTWVGPADKMVIDDVNFVATFGDADATSNYLRSLSGFEYMVYSYGPNTVNEWVDHTILQVEYYFATEQEAYAASSLLLDLDATCYNDKAAYEQYLADNEITVSLRFGLVTIS